jgi:hypothetical protein
VRRTLLVAALISACGTVAAPAPSTAPTPTAPAVLLQAPSEACGTVKAWAPPTATQAGSITLGSATHSVNAGTNHGSTGFGVAVGTDMCLFGGLDGQTAASVGATVIDSPFCGAVLAFTPASAGTAGSVTLLHFAAAALTIPAGLDLGAPRLGVRRCVTVGTTSAGDAIVRSRAAPSILDMESSLWCGRVVRYTRASAGVPGELAIGSKSWLIADGVAYESAGPNPPDRTTLGTPACLTAAFDDAGRITRYLTSDMPASESGIVTSYAPATATATGTLVFSYKYVRAVAVGVTLTGVTVGSRTCVKAGVDPAGDRVVTGSTECGGVGF